jgi:hypothetical protein
MRGNPQGTVAGGDPGAVLRGDRQHALADVDQLMIVVAMALAATLGSGLPQIPIGLLADRRGLPWMCALGVSVADIAAGLSG